MGYGGIRGHRLMPTHLDPRRGGTSVSNRTSYATVWWRHLLAVTPVVAPGVVRKKSLLPSPHQCLTTIILSHTSSSTWGYHPLFRSVLGRFCTTSIWPTNIYNCDLNSDIGHLETYHVTLKTYLVTLTVILVTLRLAV